VKLASSLLGFFLPRTAHLASRSHGLRQSALFFKNASEGRLAPFFRVHLRHRAGLSFEERNASSDTAKTSFFSSARNEVEQHLLSATFDNDGIANATDRRTLPTSVNVEQQSKKTFLDCMVGNGP
jgi:hypothetical protein